MKAPQQLLLHAMHFVAFGHLSDVQLLQTPFKSIAEGQTALFRIVRTSYHLHSKASDPMILAQVALLLSSWSPYDNSIEVNSFWVEHAIRHAQASGCFETYSTGQEQVIGWCCFVRNRSIALGLRRPHLLCDVHPGRMLEPEDFQLVMGTPESSWMESDWCAIWSFIFLCRLSEIMAAVIKSRTTVQWVPWWKKPHMMGQISRVDNVTQLEKQLDSWEHDFDQ